jgi:pimeloyl-ACP methyl ester carboxylesterase
VRVVLLHAFPLEETMWEPQAQALEAFSVAAPRLYERGASVDEWARSVLAELGGDDELVAVGASLGGYVALAMARAAPDRIAGLVLAGSRAGADTPERKEARNGAIEALRADGVAGLRGQAPFEPTPGVTAAELVGALEVLRDRPDATDTVARFAGPLLVVVGSDDELLPAEEARGIAALAPDGRAEVVPGAGHLVSRDRAERFNGLLVDFLARWT